MSRRISWVSMASMRRRHPSICLEPAPVRPSPRRVSHPRLLLSHPPAPARSPSGCSSRKRTSALPTTTPSATAAAARHLLGRRDAEAERHRLPGQGPETLARAGRASAESACALAGHAGAAHGVHEAAGGLGHPPQALVGARGRGQEDRVQVRRRARPPATPPPLPAAGRSRALRPRRPRAASRASRARP